MVVEGLKLNEDQIKKDIFDLDNTKYIFNNLKV